MAKDNSPQNDPAERIRRDIIGTSTDDDVLLTKLAEQQACSCTTITAPSKPEKPDEPEKPTEPEKPEPPKKPEKPDEPE